MTWDKDAVVEAAAKAWRPYLWRSVADITWRVPHLREVGEESLARRRAESCEEIAPSLPVIVGSVTDEVRALHYAADKDGARTPQCETCHGKAGVHECGCWAPRDRVPVCGHCNDRWHGVSVPWPCPTVRLLDEIDASAGVQR